MSCGGFWLDSKCIEALSKLGELIKKIRLAARLHPEKIEQYCRQLTELVKLAVEVEEMREKAPETALEAKLNRQASLDAESPIGFRGCGKRSERPCR